MKFRLQPIVLISVLINFLIVNETFYLLFKFSKIPRLLICLIYIVDITLDTHSQIVCVCVPDCLSVGLLDCLSVLQTVFLCLSVCFSVLYQSF